MIACTASVIAKYTDSMGFIHHDAGIVLLGQPYDFGHMGHVSFHAEDTVSDDQFHLVRLASTELFFQRLHVVMLIFELV